MEIGIQLFGLLNGSDQEPLALLRELAAAGVRYFEPCVALDAGMGLPASVWPISWFREHAPALVGESGLEMRTCHVFAGDIGAHADELAALAREHGIRAFVVQCPSELSEERLQESALRMLRAADALEKAGAELWLHNGSAEIERKVAGVTAYEALLDRCMGRVGAQVDVGWVWHGGEDPAALLRRNAWRVRSVHYKDFVGAPGSCEETAAGAGAVDTAACFRFARAHGCLHVIDRDVWPAERGQALSDAVRAIRGLAGTRGAMASFLHVADADTGAVRTVGRYEGILEAPNWIPGEEAVLCNRGGRIWRVDIATGGAEPVDTGLCDRCNNDHVLSADGKTLAVSHMPPVSEGFASYIYAMPLGSGAARQVTPLSPSFLHGISPDGNELAYCAFRRGGAEICVIPAEGGKEVSLTAEGFSDGPEYSPDGKHIWFCSTRSGRMQLWRMGRDGSAPKQMRRSDRNDWFPHVSPDGERVLFLSYAGDELEPAEHLPEMRVELWLMRADGSRAQRFCRLFGGQGTCNVNSWAGDSRRFAFVSYEEA